MSDPTSRDMNSNPNPSASMRTSTSASSNTSARTTNFGELGRTYRITPIQQPERAAAFRGLYLSRLPIAPPLIIQFDCWDADQQLIIPYEELPFLICHLSIETPEGVDATMVRSPEGQPVPMLYGSTVTSPAEMTDLNGDTGVYFAFPDVSVRYAGKFRLKATLMRITGGPYLKACVTEPFEVVRDVDYVAPPITDLTRHFDAQNVIRFGLPRSEW